MKYSITSTAWQGEIIVEYSESQLLVNCDLSGATLSEKQHMWFLKNLPRELYELQKLIDNAPTAKIMPVNQDITFDQFWKRYQAPPNSKKKVALARWNKLSKADKVKAFNHIRKYELNMQQWQSKMYAETYLNSELWNN